VRKLPKFMLDNISIKDSGCWEWAGKRMSPNFNGGYGRISIDGTTYAAHRLAYTFAIGDVPQSLVVCHKCDNPPCCNPEHLFLRTLADNMLDCTEKKRLEGRKGVGAIKLKAYWPEICGKFDAGIKLGTLAKEYGTSVQTIRFIVYGYVNCEPNSRYSHACTKNPK